MTSCCYHSSNIDTVDLAYIAKANGIIKMKKFTLSLTLASLWVGVLVWSGVSVSVALAAPSACAYVLHGDSLVCIQTIIPK